MSEAINSMYAWYANAYVCFVYLGDYDRKDESCNRHLSQHGEPEHLSPAIAKASPTTVLTAVIGNSTEGPALSQKPVMDPSCEDPKKSLEPGIKDALGQCRWFSRGWTLQELLAPFRMCFYDCKWEFLGTKMELSPELSAITNIPSAVLEGRTSKDNYSIAARMSLAAKRVTTRGEDIAYCLFGLFDINLPLLYGEGPVRAFLRLQEAIIQRSNDLSIFAWPSTFPDTVPKTGYSFSLADVRKNPTLNDSRGVLARSPRAFAGSGDIVCKDLTINPEFSVTNKGIKLSISQFENSIRKEFSDHFDLLLNCHREGYAGDGSLYISLKRLNGSTWYRQRTVDLKTYKKIKALYFRNGQTSSYLAIHSPSKPV